MHTRTIACVVRANTFFWFTIQHASAGNVRRGERVSVKHTFAASVVKSTRLRTRDIFMASSHFIYNMFTTAARRFHSPLLFGGFGPRFARTIFAWFTERVCFMRVRVQNRTGVWFVPMHARTSRKNEWICQQQQQQSPSPIPDAVMRIRCSRLRLCAGLRFNARQFDARIVLFDSISQL